MSNKKKNTLNVLKDLIKVPISDMKPNLIHLSSMISYLHCNKMFRGNFKIVKEGADVKRIKYGSCDIPFAVGEK